MNRTLIRATADSLWGRDPGHPLLTSWTNSPTLSIWARNRGRAFETIQSGVLQDRGVEVDQRLAPAARLGVRAFLLGVMISFSFAKSRRKLLFRA